MTNEANTPTINNQFNYYMPLSMLYCTFLMVSVLFPYKIINIFGFSEPGGIFIFPATYLLGGAIADQYGRKLAIKMVYSSIGCLLTFNLLIAIIVRIPSAPDAPNQEVFLQALGQSFRLSIGCVIGLICSDLTNIYKITGLKLLFAGRYFIQRCLWSTALSEALFNLTTYTITYLNILPINSIFKLMINSWCLKMLYSIFMAIPLLILMRFLKRSENTEVTDINISNSWTQPEAILVKFLLATEKTERKVPDNV